MEDMTSNKQTNEPFNKLSQGKIKTISNGKDNYLKQHQRISNLAYQKAEKRGFVSSDTDILGDWLEAEEEIKQSENVKSYDKFCRNNPENQDPLPNSLIK